MIEIQLPYPPTVNTYYRHVGNKVLISREGRAYRNDVAAVCMLSRVKSLGEARLAVEVDVFPPDRRARDIDNLCKGLLDAIQHAGVYENDSQIDRLTLERHEPCQGGRVVVRITPVED